MRRLWSSIFLLFAFLLSGQNSDNWEVVYLNDFSKEDPEWFTTESTNNISRIAVSNSRLVLELFDHGTKRAIDYTEIDFNKDFILKAEIGSKGDAKLNKRERSDFGLYFGYSAHRYHQKQGMYAFMLNFYQKGVHIFAQNEDGSKAYKTIVKNVKYNPRAYTNIGVMKEGNTVTYYLNGKLIFTEKAVKSAGGAMTFLAFRKMKAFMRKLAVYHKPEDIPKERVDFPSSDYPEKLKSVLTKIQFETNSAELTTSSDQQVKALAGMLTQLKSIQIKIEVHTDDFGKLGELKILSESRANKLHDLLVSEGVDGNSLMSEGYGDLFPVTDSFFPEDIKKNERVEIKFMPPTETQAPTRE